MILLPLFSLPQSPPKAPLEEVAGQDQGDLQSPTNPHTSRVVLDHDRNYQASEGQKTLTSSLEMRRLQPPQDPVTAYTIPSDMGW